MEFRRVTRVPTSETERERESESEREPENVRETSERRPR